MTGYYAQWNNAQAEASKLKINVRSMQYDGRPVPDFEYGQPAGAPNLDCLGASGRVAESSNTRHQNEPLENTLTPITGERASMVNADGKTESHDNALPLPTAEARLAPASDAENVGESAVKSSVDSGNGAIASPVLRGGTPRGFAAAAPVEPFLEPSFQWSSEYPSDTSVDPSWPALSEPPFETENQVEHASRAAIPETEPTAVVPLAQPADFSDLIALAGPVVLDDRYHDHPLGELASLPAFAGGPQGCSIQLPLEADESDPLTALTFEYRQALLHHKRDYSLELKKVSADNAPIVTAPLDPLLDASERYAEGSLLDDLLGSSQTIDTVLEDLDTFGADQIFKADEQHEILALLAPGGVPDPSLPQPALLARQEHHLISVDSHIPMPHTTQPEELNSEHENHH